MAQEHGPIFRFYMGRQPLVMVANAELCKEVGIKRFRDIRNRSAPPPTVGSPLHRDALFLARDSAWASMRSTVVPLYQPARLAQLVPTMRACVDALVDAVDQGSCGCECVPFSQLSLRLAIDIIGKTAFGIEFGLLCSKKKKEESDRGEGDEARELLGEYERSMEFMKMDLSSSLSTVLGLFLPCVQSPCKRVLRRVPGTADHKMEQNERRLCRRIDAIIAARRRRDSSSSPSPPAALDFIAALLEDRGCVAALEDRHVRAAGVRAPDRRDQDDGLHALLPRVPRLLPPPRGGEASSRARRLRPSFPQRRRAPRKLPVPRPDHQGIHAVPPGVAADRQGDLGEFGDRGILPPEGHVRVAGVGVLARDAAQFPDPDEFRPERFAADGEEERARNPYAHIPFGIGPRACVGHRFALQQVKLAVVGLYRRYVFRHSPEMESPVQFEFDLVLGFRHGVKLRAIRTRED